MSDDQKNFDCSQCSDDEKESRGCVESFVVDENIGISYWWSEERLDLKESMNPTWADDMGEFVTYCCPLCCLTEYSREMVNLYNTCKDLGCLPYEGGLLSQPWNLVQSFMIIAGEIGTKLAEDRDKQQRETSRKARATTAKQQRTK